MAQPMRECPVCEAIVLLDQEFCTICDHDLSKPAPAELPDVVAPRPAPPPALDPALEADVGIGRRNERVREGSVLVGLVCFIAAALLIGWYVRLGGPLDEIAERRAEALAQRTADIDRARSICRGSGAGVTGAPAYSRSSGIHPAAIVVGDLAEVEPAPETSLPFFPGEWVVDLSARPLATTELLLCVDRTSGEQVDSTCPSVEDPVGIVRLEADYLVRVYETATSRLLVEEPIGGVPFEPCPADAVDPSGTVYSPPDPPAIVEAVVPLIVIG